MIDNMYTITEYLFSQDFFDDDFDPDGEEVNLNKAQDFMEQYPWNDIISLWHEYLYKNCHTPEKVINFANLFIYYGGADGYNPEPYKFLGYLFFQVDMDKYYDEAYDTFEAISLHILEYQCLIDLTEDPYYSCMVFIEAKPISSFLFSDVVIMQFRYYGLLILSCSLTT